MTETVELSNGVSMPMEGFGVFQIPEQECEQVIRNAIESGYRLIDTASSYQNEEAVGRAVKTCGIPREELFITTKAYIQEMGYDDYYGSWRAMEELYRAGRIRAIGVCNFLPDRLLDFCYNVEIKPQVNQIERHPHYQRAEDLQLMEELGVQPEAWAPFAEGLKGMFEEPVLMEIAAKHQKTPAQILLRWNVQQGVIVIPKSVHMYDYLNNPVLTSL